MKKYIIIAALATFVSSSTVYAATLTAGYGLEVTGQKGSETAQTIGKLSNNVGAEFNYDDTSYAVITKHKNGNKEYGSSSGDTKLFYQEADAGAAPSAPDASDSSSFNSWSSL